jgi:hypothetical protein
MIRKLLALFGIFGLLAVPVIAQGQKITVRPLKADLKDPTIAFKIGGQSKLTLLKNAAEVEMAVGKASAKGLTDQVDFTKESIVLVSWTTSGPPDGILMHETKKGTINFFVQGPKSKVRGERARIGADFFAVPAGVKATFEAKER